MTLSPSAYVDAFAYDSPSRVGRKLGQRLASAKHANDKLGALFAERAEIEENYANALQAAIQRWERAGSGHMVPGSPSAQAVERTIVNETSAVAALHQKFAARCRRDIQQPLTSRHTSQDWALLRGLEQNSESLLNDNQDNQNAKSSKSGTSSLIPGRSKNTNAESSRNSEQWKENAPALLNQYQQVDAGRLNTLKELLTVFETLQNDLGRERMEIAERGLAAILSWEVEQEMTEFISREGFKSSGGAEESTQSATPAIAVQSPTVNDFGAYNGSHPQRRNIQTDAQSFRSNGRAPSVISSRLGGAGPGKDNDEKDGKSKKKGGLLSAFKKNKGDKRKSVAPPPPAGRADSSDGNFGASARDSRDRQSSTRSGASSDDFGQDSGALRPSVGGGRKSNRDSFMPSFSSLGLKRRGTMNSPAATPALNTSSQAPAQSPYEEAPDLPTPPARRGSQDTASGTAANPFAASMRQNTAGPAVEQVNLFGDDEEGQSTAQRQVDNQGYSVPPQDYNRPLGSSTSGANLMDMPDSDDENDTPRAMKVNIQPATNVSREDDAEREAAMLRMKNTLSAGLSPSPSSINRRGTRANRSSRQSTLGSVASNGSTVTPPAASPGDEVPIAQIMEMNRQQRQPPPIPQHRHTSTIATSTVQAAQQPQPTSPTEVLASPPLTASPPTMRNQSPVPRAGSVLSTSSSQLFSPAGQGKSPFSPANAPGLRASILETVNIILQGGQVTRVMVTGEVSMSLVDVAIDGPLKLRIDGFEALDRSAPNTSILSGSAGEYSVNANALQNSRTGLTTVFKYSLSTQGMDARALVPIEVTPQWKIEPNQTSFLMAYHGNPACQFAAGEDSPFGADDGTASGAPTTLHDLAFSVPIASGCTNLQTKPDGVYSEERKQIVWQMDEFDITETRTAKILARFQTDTEGTQQPVSVSWKLPGRLASKIGIHIDGANLDEIARNTQSGKYIAQA